jgi:3-dehydroquinate synthetase/shikimate kinase
VKERRLISLSSLSSQANNRAYPEKNIFLTGFMGSGKTTVGRLLAKALGRPFVDMDEELAALHNKSVREIFAEAGEAFFRQAESGLLATLDDQDQPKVIATGGGIVLSQANCQILKGALTFFLDLPAEAAWERISANASLSRPLATDLASFRNLMASRLDLYRRCGAIIPALPAPAEVARNILDFVLWQEPIVLKAEGRSCVIRSYAPASSLPSLRDGLLGQARAMVLLDHHFRDDPDAFLERFRDSPVAFASERGEAAKSLDEVSRLLLIMAGERLDRSDFLVVRGGGSLTDLGALCAGLYRRGLNLVLAPTTVLAAVDAAIGGKAAVNLAGAKNQAGLFYLPREVWIDPLVLRSLPGHLLREGLVEALKTALLFDPALLDLISRQLDNILAGDLLLLAQIVHDSARHKAALVAKDLREEKGIRDVLNLGHTYGHAVESHNAPRIGHGRAVALGLAVALAYSQARHGLDGFVARTGVAVCRRLAGGAFPPAPPPGEARRLLGFDKKTRAGRLRFVALRAPGQPFLEREADPEDILAAAETLLSGQPGAAG